MFHCKKKKKKKKKRFINQVRADNRSIKKKKKSKVWSTAKTGNRPTSGINQWKH